MEKDIMKYESVLPEDFDGTFRFTNDSDEDFVARWGNKEYVFPARTTSPILIANQTPLEIQQIRKKFAKDWAEREFFKGVAYRKLKDQERNRDGSPRLNSIQQAGTYSLQDLTPYIQRCLKPLPISKAQVRETKREPLEDKLSTNEKGQLNTEAIDGRTSLRDRALKA